MCELQEKINKHLLSREGYRDYSYKDSLGKLTGGVGHLLSKEEQERYPLHTPIDKDVINGWLTADSSKALKAAKEQAIEMDIDSLDFLVALTSVNFQLGTRWYKNFPTAYKRLKDKEYTRAISEIKYVREGSTKTSMWYNQTPTRVNDFIRAIDKLS